MKRNPTWVCVSLLSSQGRPWLGYFQQLNINLIIFKELLVIVVEGIFYDKTISNNILQILLNIYWLLLNMTRLFPTHLTHPNRPNSPQLILTHPTCPFHPKLPNSSNSYQLWQSQWLLRHWIYFWELRTWIHDNLCYLTIKSTTGQHSQFLRCFHKKDRFQQHKCSSITIDCCWKWRERKNSTAK